MKKCVWTLALALIALPALAKTPDGQPPSEETVCDGERGAAFGLCNAYCEAMDCDFTTPHASPTACAKVKANFMRITGRPLPCEATCPCTAITLFADFVSGSATIDSCVSSPNESRFRTDDGQFVVIFSGGCQANFEDPFVELTPDEAALCTQILLDKAPECESPE